MEKTSKQCGNNTFVYYKLSSLMGTDDVDYVWLICALLVLIGNICVLVLRCTRRSDQRSNIPSILIINLATANLLLGIQMLLYLPIPWPCFAFEHETAAAAFCDVSAWLQMLGAMMSSVTTITIVFHYIICLTCSSRCSRKCIVVILVSEWILLSCLSCGLTFYFSVPYTSFIDDEFDFSICVPISGLVWIFGSVIAFLLLIALIVYIVLLIKIKQQGNRPDALASFAQIQLMLIAFASFILWAMSVLIELFSLDGLYYDQYCIAGVAISNPLVFTLLSKPFIKSAKRVWQCFCYKCGCPTPIDQIHSSEGEGDPLLTKVASQTNYLSSDGRTDV